jgi:alpha-tubulin suppressor-like RCC1 family protein
MDDRQNWTKVSCGFDFTIALNSNGQLYGCGNSKYGALCVGGGNVTSLTKLTDKSDWVQVSCGHAHVLALDSSGNLYAWGSNRHDTILSARDYQLGAYPRFKGLYTPIPIQIGVNLDVKWTKISAGRSHSAAIAAPAR